MQKANSKKNACHRTISMTDGRKQKGNTKKNGCGKINKENTSRRKKRTNRRMKEKLMLKTGK